MYYIAWEDKDKEIARKAIWAICHMDKEDVTRLENIFDAVSEMTTQQSAEYMLYYGKGKAIAYYEITRNDYWFDISLALNSAIIESD